MSTEGDHKEFQEVANSPEARASTLAKLEKAYNRDIRLRVFSMVVTGILLMIVCVCIVIELYQAENVPGRNRLYLALAVIAGAAYLASDKLIFAKLKDKSEDRILALEMICKEHKYKEEP